MKIKNQSRQKLKKVPLLFLSCLLLNLSIYPIDSSHAGIPKKYRVVMKDIKLWALEAKSKVIQDLAAEEASLKKEISELKVEEHFKTNIVQTYEELEKDRVQQESVLKEIRQLSRLRKSFISTFEELNLGQSSGEELVESHNVSTKLKELYILESEISTRIFEHIHNLNRMRGEIEKSLPSFDDDAGVLYEYESFLAKKSEVLDSLKRGDYSESGGLLPEYLKSKRMQDVVRKFKMADWKKVNSLLDKQAQVDFPTTMDDYGDAGFHNHYFGEKIEEKLRDLGSEFQDTGGLLEFVNELLLEVKKVNPASRLCSGSGSGSSNAESSAGTRSHAESSESASLKSKPKSESESMPVCKENEFFDPFTRICEPFHFEVSEQGKRRTITLQVGTTGVTMGGLYCTQDGHIWDVYIKPRLQGLGLGKKLLDFGIKSCKTVGQVTQKKLYLEVYKGNLPALKNYLSFGFKITGDDEDDGFEMEYLYP